MKKSKPASWAIRSRSGFVSNSDTLRTALSAGGGPCESERHPARVDSDFRPLVGFERVDLLGNSGKPRRACQLLHEVR